MELEQDRIRIGEQAVLHLYFQYDNPKEDALIGWPYYDDRLTEEIEILDRTVDYEALIDSASSTFLREQKLVITVFEEGEYPIPPQRIELNDSVFYTNPEYLVVQTVKVDTSESIKPIKDNYEVPYPFSERSKDWFLRNWYWFAISAVLAAIFLLVRVLKKRKGEEEEEEIPQIPAHITALNSLHELRLKEAWKSENRKQYYSNLTDTVRLYLEQRFGIYAMEQTTREIIEDLRNSDISDEDKEFLRKILSQADMVKFAKVQPDEESGHQSLNRSIEFVDKTKKEETEEQNNTEEDEN
jgi:hypothetical protein